MLQKKPRPLTSRKNVASVVKVRIKIKKDFKSYLSTNRDAHAGNLYNHAMIDVKALVVERASVLSKTMLYNSR